MVFENFNHVNSNGEMFEFKKYGISINENSFRDYIWKYSTINNRITSFYKECETFPLELTVNIRGRNDYNDIKNKKATCYGNFYLEINKVPIIFEDLESLLKKGLEKI